MFFLLFLLDDRKIRISIFDQWIRMRIREAQKHTYGAYGSGSATLVFFPSYILTCVQVLVLTVLATLVKYTTDENEVRILYEYLAEASVVFPKVGSYLSFWCCLFLAF
jgi:hypothetical protein